MSSKRELNSHSIYTTKNMGILWRHNSSVGLPYVTFLFVCLLLVSPVSSLGLIKNSIPKSGLGGRLGWTAEMEKQRRRLGGLGSWPPACKSKCGVCSPCDAVHVPIQPGFSTPQEYYPEAWRCKCGNKLFMP